MLFMGQQMSDLAWDTRQLPNRLLGLLGAERSTQLAQVKYKNIKSSELGNKSFAGRNADFGAGMRVDGSSRLACNHRAHHITNRHRLGAFGFGFSLRGNSVRSLTGLRNEHGDRVGP